MGTNTPAVLQDHGPWWEKSIAESHGDKVSAPGHSSCYTNIQSCFKTGNKTAPVVVWQANSAPTLLIFFLTMISTGTRVVRHM